jgi:hypothetical protein
LASDKKRGGGGGGDGENERCLLVNWSIHVFDNL